MKAPPHTTNPPVTAPTHGATAPTSVTRVLIVDDEAAMRALTRAIIEGLGYEAIDATNGEEAIETFKSAAASHQPISAVIMDLALPGGMSGIETTDHLKEINSQVKVIASSGYLQQNARAAAIERGFSGILPKPFSHERLTAELRWVLTRG